MKTKITILLLIFISSAVVVSCGKLSSDKSKWSFALAHQIGNNMKHQKIDIDADAFEKGLIEGLEGKNELLSPKEQVDSLKAMVEILNMKKAGNTEDNFGSIPLSSYTRSDVDNIQYYSNKTSLEREQLLGEMVGKKVKWTLIVDDVQKNFGGFGPREGYKYKVTTVPSVSIYGNDEKWATLKKDQRITVTGIIYEKPSGVPWLFPAKIEE